MIENLKIYVLIFSRTPNETQTIYDFSLSICPSSHFYKSSYNTSKLINIIRVNVKNKLKA